MKTSLFFVSGASGVGKTSIIPFLKEQLTENYVIHDFDERGVPENVDENWRRIETRYWESVAKKNVGRKKTTVVCGLSQPDEVGNWNSVGFVYLDADNTRLKQRLTKRYSRKKNILLLEKATGQSPEKFIKNNIKHNVKLRKLCKQYNCEVINTTNLTLKETAVRVALFIKKKST